MKIVNAIFGTLLTVVLLLFVLVGAMNFFSAPDSGGLFGYKGYVVTSASMEPTFAPGDYIVVKADPFGSVEEGDVVTFVDGGTIVTHRAQERTPEGVITKGDANKESDQVQVTEQDYIGSLRFILPRVGLFVLFLQKPFIFPVLLFLVGGYLIYLYYQNPEKEQQNQTSI